MDPAQSSFQKCSFIVDYHLNDPHSLTAHVTNESPEKLESDTFGAAWPPGRPSESFLFEIKTSIDTSSQQSIEFRVSRHFLKEHSILERVYMFQEIRSCPELSTVILEGDDVAIKAARDRKWLNKWCETLVYNNRALDTLVVRHVSPYAYGLMSLNTVLIFVPRERNIFAKSLTLDKDTLLRPILGSVERFAKILDGSDCDIDNTVFLDSSLFHELQVEPFSMCRIVVDGNSRIVSVASNPSGSYATPQLLFNLSHGQRPCNFTVTPIEYARHFASEVNISLVQSPNYDSMGEYSEAISSYFKRPRLLSKSDVLAISYRSDQDEDGVVYFEVKSLTGEVDTLWCDSNNSNLYQTGTSYCRVPRCAELVQDYHPIFNGPLVRGRLNELLEMVTLFEDELNRSVKPFLLVSGPYNCGKSLSVKKVSLAAGLHLFRVRGANLAGDTPAASESKIRNALEKALRCAPCVVEIKDLDHIFRNVTDPNDTRIVDAFLETLGSLSRAERPVIVIATSSEPSKIPTKIMSAIVHHTEMGYTTREERLETLKELFGGSAALDFARIAENTASFVLGDLCALHSMSTTGMLRRVGDTGNVGDTVDVGRLLAQPMITMDDIDLALKRWQQRQSAAIGAPRIPSVRWDDIGGLEAAKKDILDTVLFPTKNRHLAASSKLHRSGILLYGPPGTGKTLLAKAVATECSLNFLSVKGPEIINKYIGQSEENVRRIFEKARSASPCIIFFDELDSLAPNRGRSGDSGGVMDRIVSQLLSEMDGLGKSSNEIFIIAATNRPDLLDSAVLRPGRLDRLIYVDIPSEPGVKLKVLEALTRKMKLEKSVDLRKICEECPTNLTGADLYSLCANAMMNAVRSCIESGRREVVLRTEHFQDALSNLQPSVSEEELYRYRSLQEKFSLG